ncbi:MAG TPA: phospholipid carrier-dependent glycosyltransferase [Vulgatibacter sp.]
MTWPIDIALSLAIPIGATGAIPIVAAWERRNGVLDWPLRFAASLAVFLSWVQLGGMLLGFAGYLRTLAVVLWLAVGAAFVVHFTWIGRGSLRFRKPRPPGPALLLGIATGAVYLLQATVPPWYRDSLVYHLALPRHFAMAGGYVRPDDNLFFSFPLGWESILTMLHALGPAPDRFPPFNPRLLGVWTTFGAAFAATGLARAAGASARAAPWAGALLLLVPTVFEFGTSAYVEPWLLLLATLSLVGVTRAYRGQSGFLAPAAVCAGLAASVKYPGVAVILFLALLVLGTGLRRSEEEGRRAFADAARFLGIAVAVGSPFYVRNWIDKGNPVFPLAFDVFGGAGWDSWRDVAYGITLSNYGLGREIVDYLLLPIRLFFATSMRTGFEGSLGPVVGAGLVGAVALIRSKATGRTEPKRAWAGLLAFVLLWSGFWAFSVQQVRFYLVAVPALLAFVVVMLDRLPVRVRRGAVGAVAAVAVAWLGAPLVELARRQETLPWLAGDRTEAQILSTLLPDSYVPMRELEKWVPASGKVWLVWMRGYTYYLRRPYRLDSVFEAHRLEALLDEAASPSAALDRLRAGGISHLLVNGRFFLQDGNADLRPGRTDKIRRLFDALVSQGDLRPITTWEKVVLYEVGPTGDRLPSALVE